LIKVRPASRLACNGIQHGLEDREKSWRLHAAKATGEDREQRIFICAHIERCKIAVEAEQAMERTLNGSPFVPGDAGVNDVNKEPVAFRRTDLRHRNFDGRRSHEH
jgi:hypothetical protein